MKILKTGKTTKAYTFKCGKCGCEFEVSEGEYFEYKPLSLTSTTSQYIYANCPECYKMCNIANPNLSSITITTAKDTHSTPTAIHKADSSICTSPEVMNEYCE